MKTLALAAHGPHKPLSPIEIERRQLQDKDILIEVLYCGICHSDVHVANNEWNNTLYPVVPGHEIIGKVTKVGGKASKFTVGSFVGVGCIIGSCLECPCCKKHLEQYCEKGFQLVFNSQDPKTEKLNFGGFSKHMVIHEDYALHIPKAFESSLASAAPLLCAGITTYSPLKHFVNRPGMRVGILGMGGLGHMAIQLARAMEHHVTVFTSSKEKAKEARRFGADEVIITTHPGALDGLGPSYDFILNTISYPIDLDPYLNLLRFEGVLCLVGLPAKPFSRLEASTLIHQRRSLAGSLIGSIEETSQMLAFCAHHGITAQVEVISAQDVNKAFERILKGDIKYRFVIDMSTLNL